MSISHYREFFNPQCDRCGALDRAGWSMEEAEQIAREDGWRSAVAGGKEIDLCPLCRKERKHIKMQGAGMTCRNST